MKQKSTKQKKQKCKLWETEIMWEEDKLIEQTYRDKTVNCGYLKSVTPKKKKKKGRKYKDALGCEQCKEICLQSSCPRKKKTRVLRYQRQS